MRNNTVVCGLLVLVSACGDSGGDTLSASDSQTGSVGNTSSGTGDTDLPTGGNSGSATEVDDGTASLSMSGTTSTTDDPDTVGSLSLTGETTATTTTPVDTGTDTGTTTLDDTDTGTAGFCSAPEDVPVADVPLNEACDIPLQVGSFNPVIEWKYGAGSFYGPPVAGQTIDTNNSGKLDAQDKPLVFLYENTGVTALWGDGSGVAWQKAGMYGNYGGLGLGDLDGDGWNEIVTALTTRVCALDGRDGSEKWCTDVPPTSVDNFGFNYPAIGDMDGDGKAEVVVGSAILDSAGGLIATGAHGFGSANGMYGSLSALVDLDADGVMEVVTGNAAYDLDGNNIWYNGGIDGIVAVADFDLDGAGEIVKTTGPDVWGMESDGTVVWGPLNYGGNIGTPAIDDLDGDGKPELVFGAQNNLVALRWGGAEFWKAPIQDLSGAAGPVLFDFEKDGYPEVLYADEVAIRFFSGLDGSPKFQSMSHSSATALETPIVADVDGDNHVEIVLGHGGGNAEIGALTVYGDLDNTWPPGRKIWNQHTYSITNVTDLGAIPKYQANWIPGFNSFRSGDAGQAPGAYNDLQIEILGVCEDQCEMGTFFMAARVRNAGTEEAPAGLPVTVRAGVGGPIVVTLETTQPVPSGKTGEVLFFEFAANKLAQSQPVITVDDTGVGEGKLFECDELNNTAVWPSAVCPTVEPG